MNTAQMWNWLPQEVADLPALNVIRRHGNDLFGGMLQ